MKRILLRTHMPMGGCGNISEILLKNYIGDNTGNLIFQESVMKVIMREDVEVSAFRSTEFLSKTDFKRINQEYDLVVLPLANAFRIGFIPELKKLTKLVNNLKIPCVVIGVGLQKDLNSKKTSFEFDEPVKDFMNAVLKKSSIVGVRGEYTYDYLKKLGYTPEKDFTVIGCPSLYFYGNNLPKPKPTVLTPKSKMAVTFGSYINKNLFNFFLQQMKKYSDFEFISQVVGENYMLYLNYNLTDSKVKIQKGFPINLRHPWVTSGKMVGFLDPQSWISYLKKFDFSYGSRIHGNIANILAGNPCYLITEDARVAELARYHQIPYKTYKDIKDGENIIDLYEKADYSQLLKGHSKRVDHYFDFLERNNVPHISRELLNSDNTPFDDYIKSKKTVPVLLPKS